ncbi:hypothetical protein D3C76_361160 [compost metagenome]
MLVGVIWFLAVMALVVGGAVLWIERGLDGVEAERQLLQREIGERSMLSRLTWLISTNRLTVAGQTTPDSIASQTTDMDASSLPVGAELPLDGREYCLANGWCFTLMDHAARLSLSAGTPATLTSLLVGLGVPAESTPQMLLDLGLYMRARAAFGGEGAISARLLRSPMEVFVLPSWRRWEDLLVARGWCDFVSVNEAGLNLNTVDPALLSLAFGFPAESASRLLAIRTDHPIMMSSDVAAVFGIHAGNLPEDGWSRLASSILLIRLRPANAVARYEYQLNFGADELHQSPWQFLQRRSLQANVPDATNQRIVHDTPGVLAAPLVASP